INSKRRREFSQIVKKATSGAIPKECFGPATLRLEFDAVHETKRLLEEYVFPVQDTKTSYFYHKFMDTPKRFEDFPDYIHQVSPHRNPLKEYELMYDKVINERQRSNKTDARDG
ncbi:MAG: hypothetical protein JSW59_04640, partial [Phycisphaerales bacterium]